MKLELLRIQFMHDRTLGILRGPGVLLYTLEDEAQSAAPYGEYEVLIDHSEHFQTETPRLLDVPEHEEVRVHPGDKPANKPGSVLVGRYFGADNTVRHSRDAFTDLMTAMEAAYTRGEKLSIQITQGASANR